MPERVTVSINPLRIERLHFLHAVGWGFGGVTPVVRYIITHRDGKQSIITCRTGHEIADWWYTDTLKNAKVAWSGSNPATSKVQLYLYTWPNPEPANPVTAIELVSENGPTPAVVAMTALCMP